MSRLSPFLSGTVELKLFSKFTQALLRRQDSHLCFHWIIFYPTVDRMKCSFELTDIPKGRHNADLCLDRVIFFPKAVGMQWSSMMTNDQVRLQGALVCFDCLIFFQDRWEDRLQSRRTRMSRRNCAVDRFFEKKPRRIGVMDEVDSDFLADQFRHLIRFAHEFNGTIGEMRHARTFDWTGRGFVQIVKLVVKRGQKLWNVVLR